ncbi:MAG: hypothetical protein ACRCUQ_04290 [Alphaproteobacteria bacterium]
MLESLEDFKRLLTGGVAPVARTIEEDLARRETPLHKPHIVGLC